MKLSPIVDHGYLLGLGDDDHPQYLHLNKAAQTLQQNLAVSDGITVDGVDISAHAANANAHHAQAHTLASHSTKGHTELTGVTAAQHHARYADAEAVAAIEATDLARLSIKDLSNTAELKIEGPANVIDKGASIFLIEASNFGAKLWYDGQANQFYIEGFSGGVSQGKHVSIDRDNGIVSLANNLTMSAGKTVDGVDISAHAANANAHHAQAHTLASHSTKGHTELTGVTAAQHHAKTVSAEIDHGSVGGLAGDDHTQYLHLNKASQVLLQTMIGRAATFSHQNPNNIGASVSFSWMVIGEENWPRIRYGGGGEGSARGFLIQGVGDAIKLKVANDGDLTPTRHILMGAGNTVQGANCVPVASVKTSQGSTSGSIGSMSNVDIIMNVKSFFPSMGADTGIYIVTRHIGVEYTSQFRLWNEDPGTRNYSMGWYYLS